MRTIGLLLLAASVAASAQELPQGGSEQVYVTAIDVVADVRDQKGKVPDGLKPADFVVLENGVERTVVGVEYLRAPKGPKAQTAVAAAPSTAEQPRQSLWQNVLYFETALSNSTGRVSAAREMMKHVDRLVQMGTVDVVLADP